MAMNHDPLRTYGHGATPRVGPPYLTPNEAEWIDFLRLIALDSDPPVKLETVQLLRRLIRLQERRRWVSRRALR